MKYFKLLSVFFLVLVSCKKGSIPTIETLDATAIQCNVAILNATITSDGDKKIKERGFIIGLNPGVTEDNGTVLTVDTSTSIFSLTVNKLDLNRTYYYKAYTRNKNGIAYGIEKSFTTSNDYSTLSIGEEVAGGRVAYFFQVGDAGYVNNETHGMIIAPITSPYFSWGCAGQTITTSSIIGTGLTNSTNIVNSCGSTNAAAYCLNYTSEGVDNWFLPSKTELSNIFLNAIHLDVSFSEYIWTSTDWMPDLAYVVDFASGNVTGINKSLSLRCYPVRYF
jgi:hypothetical protein